MRLPGREVCLRGLFRGSVSWYVSGVCFGGLFRTVLLPRTVKFKGSVSRVCFEGLFRGMFRGSVSPKSNFPALLKVALPKKMQTLICLWLPGTPNNHLEMVVSIGRFPIFTWEMVVSPNIHKKLVV